VVFTWTVDLAGPAPDLAAMADLAGDLGGSVIDVPYDAPQDWLLS